MQGLQKIRIRANISQQELSKRTGLSQAFICELEQGRKQPSLETMLKLSKALGCSLDELVADPEDSIAETG